MVRDPLRPAPPRWRSPGSHGGDSPRWSIAAGHIGGDPLRPAPPRWRSPPVTWWRPAAPGSAALAIATTCGLIRCGPVAVPWPRDFDGGARRRGCGGGAGGAPQTRTYQVRTYGCQMNVHDSERLAGLLEAAGYRRAADGADADVVVFNTCAVRENADNKLYGNLSHLAPRKRGNPDMQIAVGGCLAQKDRDALLRKAPWVDVVFGTHNIGSLPTLLDRARHNKVAQVEIAEALQQFPSSLPSARESAYAAWVSISVGCNNSCTFCIVPSLRGKEVDRSPADILGRGADRWSTTACSKSPCWARTSTPTASPSPTRRCPAIAAPSPSCCGPADASTGWNACGSPRRIRPSSPTTSSRRWRRRRTSAPPCTCRCNPDPTRCCARCGARTAPNAISASSTGSARPCRTPPSPPT